MSKFVQGLESRRLLSVSANTVAMDAAGVTNAAAAVKTELKTIGTQLSADVKVLTADLKAGSTKANRASRLALVKTLKADGNAALTALKADAKVLVGSDAATAKRAAKDALTLLKKPGNTVLQLKVAADATALGVSAAPLAKLAADLPALGLTADLNAVAAADPSNAALQADLNRTRGHLSSGASALTSDGNTFSATLATLKTDLNAVPATPSSLNLVGTYDGDTITSSGPNTGHVNFLRLVITSQSADGTLAGTAVFMPTSGPQVTLNFVGKARKDTTPYSDAILTGTLTDPTTPGRGMTLTGNAFGKTLQGNYVGTGGIENASFTVAKQ